jgi:hypothetical protein
VRLTLWFRWRRRYITSTSAGAQHPETTGKPGKRKRLRYAGFVTTCNVQKRLLSPLQGGGGRWFEPSIAHFEIGVIGYDACNLNDRLQGRTARWLGMKIETIVPRATITAETQKPVMNPCSVGSPLAKV